MDRKRLSTLEELQQEAADFVQTLSPREDSATLITISGELGAGKTSFVQGAARALGISEPVTSPTFVLEKVYELPEKRGQHFTRLVHIDAYRLEGSGALAPLGFADLMREPKNLVMLEWPERVSDALPVSACAIAFVVESDGTRSISYTYAKG